MKTFKAIGVIGARIAGLILGGFCVSRLWLWFVAAPFGIMPIGVPQAIGIDLLVTFVCADHLPRQQELDYKKVAMSYFVAPTVALAMGWIVHLFM